MLEWVDRDVQFDVSINAVPALILAFFVVVTALLTPWPDAPLVTVTAQVLMLVPLFLLVVATYYVALAIERDERRG